MQIKKILVDEIPQSCEGCQLRIANDNGVICAGVNGNNALPWDMNFRRHDCPLVVDEKGSTVPNDWRRLSKLAYEAD